MIIYLIILPALEPFFSSYLVKELYIHTGHILN